MDRLTGDLGLDGLNLREGLERLVGAARSNLGPPVVAVIDEQVASLLLPAQRAQVLLIVREALLNVLVHAQAAQVSLWAGVDGRRLVIRLSDDGRGFDLPRPRLPRGGGLALMQQRADAARLLLQVESARGAGTVVTLTAPLAPGRATATG